MPFTPYHLGPLLLLWAVFPRLRILPLAVAGTVSDAEPLALLTFGGGGCIHCFFHTCLGASAIALAAAVTYRTYSRGKPGAIYISAFAGAYAHILLDSFLYADMKPLLPLEANPLLGALPPSTIYSLCGIAFITSIPLILYRYWKAKSTYSTLKGGV